MSAKGGERRDLRRVRVDSLPSGERDLRALCMLVATALQTPLGDARTLLERLPIVLPRAFEAEEAAALVARAKGRGAGASLEAAEPKGVSRACAEHPRFDRDVDCSSCTAPLCSLCRVRARGAALCAACLRRRRRSRAFFRARVTFLLLVLAGVVSYALWDVRRRRARNDWDHTLDVAVVLVRRGPIDDRALALLRARLPVLQGQLEDQLRRYRPDGIRPFGFHLAGPVEASEAPPSLSGDGVADAIRYSYRLWRYARAVDAAAGVDSSRFDSRIYLVARPPASEGRQQVEGQSQERGRVGVVEVELAPEMVDFALFVATHELMHTLGATDKYTAAGRALVPAGLAEPGRDPLFPQRYAEIMARNRPVSEREERVPDRIDELGVGPATAAEIGWSTRP